MKIPYSSPNLRVIDFIRALFIPVRVAADRIKTYFSSLTGKQYILITNSCRSSLYLAYNAAKVTGEVITSPLTCKVAIDPISESGNTPVFADISLGDLNIQPEDIEHRVNHKTVAIQAIHLGGVPCDMSQIISVARNKNLMLIEDCAQSLGSTYKGWPVGSFGDVVCFSLIKNAYGIGGGILATDDFQLYQKAQYIDNASGKPPLALVLFRILRNLIESKRNYTTFFLIHQFFMSLKGSRQSYHSVKGQLRQISSIEKKIAAYQIKRFGTLHKKRKKNGKKYCELLNKLKIMRNLEFNLDDSSFTKFFVYHPLISSQKFLKALSEKNIEAMHLEQKYGSPCQEKFLPVEIGAQCNLHNYHKVHDCLISLPLLETMPKKQLEWVVNTINSLICLSG